MSGEEETPGGRGQHGQEDLSHRKGSIRSRSSFFPIENVLEGHVSIPWILLTQAVGASLPLDPLSLCLPFHGMRLILHNGAW